MYFYNSPNKPVAVWNKSLIMIRKLAENEKCEIIIRDKTGAGVEIINKNNTFDK
jgi:hypothetical protein